MMRLMGRRGADSGNRRTDMAGINQESTLAEMMAHAGFRLSRRKWVREVRGVRYEAQSATDGRDPIEALSAVNVVQVDAFPGRFTAYDTVLEMALKWAGAC
jgi:hypothetical protein